MGKPQIIFDEDGPAFVVVPYEQYTALDPEFEKSLSDEQLFDIARAGDDGVRTPHDIVKRMVAGENPFRVYREYRGLTQAEVARRTGVSVGYVGQLERGTRHLSRKKLRLFADALGADAEDLETW